VEEEWEDPAKAQPWNLVVEEDSFAVADTLLANLTQLMARINIEAIETIA
jgi:hypothetical protein